MFQGTDTQISSKFSDVVVELVMFYKYLFQLTPDKIFKDEAMLSVLDKHNAADSNNADSVKNNELKMWITLDPNPDNKAEV